MLAGRSACLLSGFLAGVSLDTRYWVSVWSRKTKDPSYQYTYTTQCASWLDKACSFRSDAQDRLTDGRTPSGKAAWLAVESQPQSWAVLRPRAPPDQLHHVSQVAESGLLHLQTVMIPAF